MGLSGALALRPRGGADRPASGDVARARAGAGCGWPGRRWRSRVLTKGLIGVVLPGLVLVVYTAVARDFAVWRRLHLVSGALIALVLAAPWFVLVSLRNPEFAHFFFIHEHFQRYLTTVHHRDAPWWYFLPQLLVGFLPWLGLSRGIVARRSRRRRAARAFGPMHPAGRLGPDDLRLLQLLELQASGLHRADLSRARHPRRARPRPAHGRGAGAASSSSAIVVAACGLAAAPYVARPRHRGDAERDLSRVRALARRRAASSPSSAWCWRGSSTGATSARASSSTRSRSSSRRPC